jgi:hypothetical protein
LQDFRDNETPASVAGIGKMERGIAAKVTKNHEKGKRRRQRERP